MTALSIFDAAREAPQAVALSDGRTRLSFAEVARRCRPLAQALLSVRPRALSLTPRADTESLLWLYAAFATGTPVLTLHQRAAPAERRAALELAGASEPPSPLPPARTDFARAQLPNVPPGAPLAYIPTSGSTGAPRLVELSRQALQASARASAANLGWEPDDAWLVCLPLAHTGGLSIVIRCLLARRTVALFEPGPSGLAARADDFVRAAEQATLLSLVPSMLSLLLDSGFAPSPKLRAVLLGGAGCSPALAARAHAARVPLLTSYGLTETASQVVTRHYDERFLPLPVRDGAVSSGHALPGVELRVDGGAIAIRAPSLFSGYVGQTGSALDAGGWLVTSDRGELGPNGELYVRGRSDDVIVSGGENVDPLEVEAALTALPGVKAACVFGTSSERFGQVVTAVLVTTDGSLGEPHHLAGLLRDRLASHKLPRRLLISESLPLTASGKVDRRACSELYRASLDAERPA